MTLAELGTVLIRLGCPAEKAALMAEQLDRRAKMDAERLGIAYETARERLIGLMAQGWAAAQRGSNRPEV